MDIQQLAQEKEFAPFHSEDIQKFSEEWLFDASSGISLKKNSSKESLKRKLRMCLQDIPSHRYLRISYFDNTYSGDTRKHRSTVCSLGKWRKNWPFSTTWPRVHIQLQSTAPPLFSPIEFCPVLWIVLWRCATLVCFWLSKGTWGGIQTVWMWYTLSSLKCLDLDA